MTPRQKREIKLLVSGLLDPRQGIFGVRGMLYVISKSLASADVLGFVILLLLSAPLVVPLAIVGNHFFQGAGLVTGALLGVGGFLAWVSRPLFIRTKIERFIKDHDYRLCLWCRHPIDSLPNRGRCPECGGGFEIENTQSLYRAVYDPRPYEPAPKVVRYRKSRAWARAKRERDRTQERLAK
jgi:hypothetical protein